MNYLSYSNPNQSHGKIVNHQSRFLMKKGLGISTFM